MKLLLIVGPPNGGKGTFGKVLTSRFNVGLVGTGDVCRDEGRRMTRLFIEAEEHMKATSSSLWPTELLMHAFGEKFTRMVREEPHDMATIDGFLRQPDQIEPLVKLVQTYAIEGVVLLNIITSDAVCTQRAKLRDRSDDKDIHVRLKEYHEHTMPAIHQLMASAHLIPVEVLNFDGENGTEEYLLKFVDAFGALFNLRAIAHVQPVLI